MEHISSEVDEPRDVGGPSSFAGGIQGGAGFAWKKGLPDNRHMVLPVTRQVSHRERTGYSPSMNNIDNESSDEPSADSEHNEGSPRVSLQRSKSRPLPKTVSHLSETSPPKANRKRGIPHVYRDFSSIPDLAGFVRKKTGGVTQPFPEKLHEMLDRANEPSIVTWLPHGRAFLVKKPKVFTEQIMPKFFRQTKLTSFQRQLNLYGFRRITQGADAGAYYHELFLRGRPHLCMRMQRQKVKGTGHKQPADAQTEPNFYAMSPSQVQQDPPESLQRSSPPPASTPEPMIYEDMSPGLRGVHGAAHLLKTIAAGLPGSATSSPFSLGRQAVDVPASVAAAPTLFPPQPTSATQTSKKEKSLSLLGRVTQSDTTVPNKQTPAPFIWPPLRNNSSNGAVAQSEDKKQEELKGQGSSKIEIVNKERADEPLSYALQSKQSERAEPAAAPIRGGGREEASNPADGLLEESRDASEKCKAEPKVDLKLHSGLFPKIMGTTEDLIENKVMRGIKTDEA